MASRTFEVASFADGAVRIEYDVNGATWRLRKMRCTNNSDWPAVIHIYHGDTLIFEQVGPAGQTVEWDVEVQLGWQPHYLDTDTGKLEPGGIEMGDYRLGAQWPGEV